MENTAFSLEHTDIPSVYKYQIGNERTELLSEAVCGRDQVSLGKDRLTIAASDQQLDMSAGVCKDENFPEKQGIPSVRCWRPTSIYFKQQWLSAHTCRLPIHNVRLSLPNVSRTDGMLGFPRLLSVSLRVFLHFASPTWPQTTRLLRVTSTLSALILSR